MSRKERSAQSHLRVDSVWSSELQAALNRFSVLFKTCAGPQGKCHIVRNACGGHVTVTSSCGRMLEAMMLTRPELKLITSSIQTHVHHHGDGGLFLLTMCSRLILGSAQSDLSPSTLNSLFATFSDIILSYLNDADCKICVRTDFSSLHLLLSYVKSVLSSKPLLALSPANCDHLCQLVVKTFLNSIPVENSDSRVHLTDGVYQLALEATPIEECRLESGILLRYPDVLAVRGARPLDVLQTSLPPGCVVSGVDVCVRVVLFTCSMSGDLEEGVDAHCEMTAEQATSVEEEAVGRLAQLCAVLEKHGVGLVLCQKVIHPRIKVSLRSKGILFVDRLGSQVIPYIQDLTGGQPMNSVLDPDSVLSNGGWVSEVRHIVLAGKSFLSLCRPSSISSISTLVLCAPWEERLLELKRCVRASLKGLAQLAQTKSLLMGGGCWQVHCAHLLQDKVLGDISRLTKAHHCTETTVRQALAIFQGSLHSWAYSLVAHTCEELYVDPSHYHLWRVPKDWNMSSSSQPQLRCSCGVKSVTMGDLDTFSRLSKWDAPPYALRELSKSEDMDPVTSDSDAACVLDCFSSSVSAFRQAVATTCLVLSISQFISDRN